MRNFQQKRSWGKIMESKPVLILLGILVVLFAWSLVGFWNKMIETGQNKKIVTDKIAELQQQKEKLSTDINNLNTAAGKEKIFRENFGLAKEGESEIVIMEDKNPPALPKSPSISSFFSSLFFWKNWFK